MVNPANPFVLDPHLRCAAHELPLSHADERWWPGLLDDGVRRLVQADELAVRRRGRRLEPIAVWIGTGWPSHGVGLRNAAGAPVRIVTREGERPVGDVDRARAPEQVHAGASYLHQGQHWRVVELDLDVGVARVEPDDGTTYTVPRRDTEVRLLDAEARSRRWAPPGCTSAPWRCTPRSSATSARTRSPAPSIDSAPLDLPRSTLRHPGGVVRGRRRHGRGAPGLDRAALPGALHAIEHAAIGMLPLFAICDRWDVGGVSTACQADTGLPTIVIYDAMPGGAGVAELGYEAADRHLPATRQSIARLSVRRRAARRASRARSAATATTTSTSAPRSTSWPRSSIARRRRRALEPTASAHRGGRALHPHRGRAADACGRRGRRRPAAHRCRPGRSR